MIVTYRLGSTIEGRFTLLQLTGVNVGDGQWHNISVVRERTIVTLSVDSDGDGYSVTGTFVMHSPYSIALQKGPEQYGAVVLAWSSIN